MRPRRAWSARIRAGASVVGWEAAAVVAATVIAVIAAWVVLAIV